MLMLLGWLDFLGILRFSVEEEGRGAVSEGCPTLLRKFRLGAMKCAKALSSQRGLQGGDKGGV
jgi:hypothetical protein